MTVQRLRGSGPVCPRGDPNTLFERMGAVSAEIFGHFPSREENFPRVSSGIARQQAGRAALLTCTAFIHFSTTTSVSSVWLASTATATELTLNRGSAKKKKINNIKQHENGPKTYTRETQKLCRPRLLRTRLENHFLPWESKGCMQKVKQASVLKKGAQRARPNSAGGLCECCRSQHSREGRDWAGNLGNWQ